MGYLGYKPADKPLTSADITDSIITSAKITDGTIALADLSATGTKDATTYLRGDNTFSTISGGITMTDIWRLTTSFTDDASPISTNLERVDSTGYGGIGTGMTQSSGIFTFPSTGYYLIRFTVHASSSTLNAPYHVSQIQITTNNSTYSEPVESLQQLVNQSGVGTYYSTSNSEFIFDVTSTANCKVKFRINAFGAVTTLGDTDYSYTYMTFIRLGDT
jgi:hypothetical protein